jgi:CBS domain-containing protein
VRDLMIARPPLGDRATTLAEALARMHETGWPELIVVDDAGAPIGVITAADIVPVPPERRLELGVGDVRSWLDRPVSTLFLHDPAERVLERGVRSYMVVLDPTLRGIGAIVGLLGPAQLEHDVGLLVLEGSRRAPPRPQGKAA